MKHIAIGIVLKLGFTFLLAPFIGIYGIISATAICFAATAALNALSLKRLVQFEILGSRALPFVGVILLQSGIGASVSWLLYHYFQPFGLNTWDAFIQTILASGFAVMIYPLLLFKLRIIGSDDIRAMPESIRNKGLRFLSVFKKYT
jgi:stage V sporulation protein B